MCEVESVEGVKNMGEIAPVDGVDCIHMDMGSRDLSASWRTWGTRRCEG
jgi:2-keto-3-deoxy-L-rhamnonate aldolase RhmA